MPLLARTFDIVNVRVTFHKAKVKLLETISFKDESEAYEEVRRLGEVDECVILQTCNRVELYMVSERGELLAQRAREYLAQRAGTMKEEALKAIEVDLNRRALRHLLCVASGLDSMILGENEILGQVWDAYLEAESFKATGPIMRTVFRRAVSTGKRVRSETGINRGPSSFGAVAVKLAESLLGGIDGKCVLVVGAGEMGTCVAKALARHKPYAIFVANRTYERALRLAEEIGGRAIKFDKLEEALLEADVVICATAAPHYILTKDLICRAVEKRREKGDLLIIDISNPRNVEESVKEIEGVRLYDIDDFRAIMERSLEEKRKSAERALGIIEEELQLLCRELRELSVRELISRIVSRVEEVRKGELAKAFSMLGSIGDRERKIIDNLTSAILKKTLLPVVENLKTAMLEGDEGLVKGAVKLFGVKDVSLLRWSEVDGHQRGVHEEVGLDSTSIFEESLRIIRSTLKGVFEGLSEEHARIIGRVVHATADPNLANLVVISDGAIETGIRAIKSGANVLTDVKMVASGINSTRLHKFGGRVLCYIDDGRASRLASELGVTRTAAAMRLAIADGIVNGAIVTIGNSPTATFELVRAVKRGEARPALIIATPVGFVNSVEAKKAVMRLDVPYITIRGPRGGSPIAVAIFNALLALAENSSRRAPK
jgi:glutamyl-tRNA reductase